MSNKKNSFLENVVLVFGIIALIPSIMRAIGKMIGTLLGLLFLAFLFYAKYAYAF